MDLQTVAFKGIINTIVRLVPISLYMGTSMSFLLYNNKRASILLLGFFFIEIIGFVFSYNSRTNPQCGLFRSPSGTTNLPAPVPTVVGFFASFLIAEMYAEEDFRPNKFFLLIVMVLIATWSRINIGCHTIVESGMAALIGLFLGFTYFNLVKDIYKEAKYKSQSSSEGDVSNEENKIYQLLNLS